MDRFLTVQQFAALVGKSPQAIYKRLNEAVIAEHKMMKKQAISELYGVMDEQPIQPGHPTCFPASLENTAPANPPANADIPSAHGCKAVHPPKLPDVEITGFMWSLAVSP